MKKILLIRFSSIGDIVLTSPVPHFLKKNIQEVEIHYLTKSSFVSLIQYNPDIAKIHLLQNDDLSAVIEELKKENFDYIIDLHNNLRTFRIKLALQKPSATFDKERLQRYFHTKWNRRNIEISHVVDRYLDAARKCLRSTELRSVVSATELRTTGLTFFYPEAIDNQINQLSFDFSQAYSIVLGATFFTKKWLPSYFVEMIQKLGIPIVLIGGKEEREAADFILKNINVPYFDAIGNHSLLEAAAIMKRTRFVVAHDTGFMHIAAAFQMKIFSLWGSTSPKLGFAPYNTENISLEVNELACHPCSKMGTKTCPKGHFKCMKELYPDFVVKKIQENIKNS